MGKKLYVGGNLSYTVNNSELEGFLQPSARCGAAEVIQDRDTGRGKGFVEMSSDEEAVAIAGLSGQEYLAVAL